MKVKLLNKLRKEAKKQYWIEYDPSFPYPYRIRRNSTISDYGIFETKERAVKFLSDIRRDYILKQLVRKLDE